MKIYFYDSEHNNFGDELSPIILRNVLPGKVFDDEIEGTIVGIGTLLNEHLPKKERKHVLGAGVGYGRPPQLDENLTVHFLRGPLSAKKLGVSLSKACTDPAILVSKYFSKSSKKKYEVSYMPHFSEAISNASELKAICESIGIRYIDPRSSVESVIRDISSSRKLLSEAMHGAIVADALRVPWVAVSTKPDILPFKWKDWTSSLDMEYKPYKIRLRSSILGGGSLLRRAVRVSFKAQLYYIKKRAGAQLSSDNLLKTKQTDLLKRYDEFSTDVLEN